jgi:hypothetical protein
LAGWSNHKGWERMSLSRFLLLIAVVGGLFVSSKAAGDEHPSWKSATYMSAWGPCPPNENCGSVWLMDRATQSIERKGLKATAPHKLSDQEWAQLEEMVRAARQQASSCKAPPTDVFETLEIVNADGTQDSVEVTGCVFDQGTNAPKTLASWLRKY